jgi:hypothetical protein
MSAILNAGVVCLSVVKVRAPSVPQRISFNAPFFGSTGSMRLNQPMAFSFSAPLG